MDTRDMKAALHTPEGRARLRTYIWNEHHVEPVAVKMTLLEALGRLDRLEDTLTKTARAVVKARGVCQLAECEEPVGEGKRMYCTTAHKNEQCRRRWRIKNPEWSR